MKKKTAKKMLNLTIKKREKGMWYKITKIHNSAANGDTYTYLNLLPDDIKYLTSLGYNVTKLYSDDNKDNYKVYWGEKASGIYIDKTASGLSGSVSGTYKLASESSPVDLDNIRRRIVECAQGGLFRVYVELDDVSVKYLLECGYDVVHRYDNNYIISWDKDASGRYSEEKQ